MGQPVTRGCSGAKQPQPAALRRAGSGAGSWVVRLLSSTFSLHSTVRRIREKQGRKVKNNVYATAEAIWAAPEVMPIEVFPYQWINNFSVNSFTSLRLY